MVRPITPFKRAGACAAIYLRTTASVMTMIVFVLTAFAATPAAAADPIPPRKMIAVTIDDLPLNGPPLPLPELRKMTNELTEKLQSNHVPAIGFVNEIQLFENVGEVDARIGLLETWLNHGMDLGNHTFSHLNLQTTPVADFEADVIRGETVTSQLLKARGKKLQYFRYPYLSTGAKLDTKVAIEKFLQDRHYKNAPVTVDAQDWWFVSVYAKAMKLGDLETAQRIATDYLAYTGKALEYSEKLSVELIGRPIRQILLMHSNQLNADQFDKVAKLINEHGYEFVPLSQALQDAAYSQRDDYVGDEGLGWFARWARTLAKPVQAQSPAEPKFVQELYKNPKYKE